MPFIARLCEGIVKASIEFVQRNLNYASARPSDLLIFGKSDSEQLAYAGYKQNIEAFVLATAIQKKVFAGQPSYPLNTIFFILYSSE